MVSLLFLLIILLYTFDNVSSQTKYRIAGGTAYYPRTIQLQDGVYLSCVTNMSSSGGTVKREISIYRSTNLKTWTYLSKMYGVTYSNTAGNIIDLDNCNLAQSSIYKSNTAIIGSFRYHTGCHMNGNNPELYCTTFSLQSSTSYDNGKTWNKMVKIVSLSYSSWPQQQPAVWEPFVFQPNTLTMNTNEANNCYNLFNVQNLTNSFQVYYSQEIYRSGSNYLQQDIRMKYTNNNGASWSNNDYVISAHANSRDGMPGVTQLTSDNSLYQVMEGFWGSNGWGYFVVSGQRSFDCGRTWTQGAVIYQPNSKAYNAGGPDTIVNVNNGLVYVSFMSDQPTTEEEEKVGWPDETWPANAYIRVVKSTNNGANGEKLSWSSNIETQSVKGCLWANVFIGAGKNVYVEYQEGNVCYVNGNPC